MSTERKLDFPDVYWAVFNGHVHDASERALALTRMMFRPDNPDLMALEAWHSAGRIMAIFDHTPAAPQSAYVALCFVLANGLLAPLSGASDD